MCVCVRVGGGYVFASGEGLLELSESATKYSKMDSRCEQGMITESMD